VEQWKLDNFLDSYLYVPTSSIQTENYCGCIFSKFSTCNNNFKTQCIYLLLLFFLLGYYKLLIFKYRHGDDDAL
jgi:hypothetical protein